MIYVMYVYRSFFICVMQFVFMALRATPAGHVARNAKGNDLAIINYRVLGVRKSVQKLENFVCASAILVYHFGTPTW